MDQPDGGIEELNKLTGETLQTSSVNAEQELSWSVTQKKTEALLASEQPAKEEVQRQGQLALVHAYQLARSLLPVIVQGCTDSAAAVSSASLAGNGSAEKEKEKESEKEFGSLEAGEGSEDDYGGWEDEELYEDEAAIEAGATGSEAEEEDWGGWEDELDDETAADSNSSLAGQVLGQQDVFQSLNTGVDFLVRERKKLVCLGTDYLPKALSVTHLGLLQRLERGPCQRFQLTQTCHFGEDCRYAHLMPAKDQKIYRRRKYGATGGGSTGEGDVTVHAYKDCLYYMMFMLHIHH